MCFIQQPGVTLRLVLRPIDKKSMLDEKALIKQILKGKTGLYRHLVDRYKDMAFTLALRITSNRHTAEEVAQEAFIKAYNKLPGFRHGSKFSSWLFRITYNTAISHLRKQRFFTQDTPLPDMPADAPPEGPFSDGETCAALLEGALDQPTAEDSTLITLYYY